MDRNVFVKQYEDAPRRPLVAWFNVVDLWNVTPPAGGFNHTPVGSRVADAIRRHDEHCDMGLSAMIPSWPIGCPSTHASTSLLWSARAGA